MDKTIVVISKNNVESDKMKDFIINLIPLKSKILNVLRTESSNTYRFLNLKNHTINNFRGIGIDIVYFNMKLEDVDKNWLESIYPVISARKDSKLIISEKFDLDLFIG